MIRTNCGAGVGTRFIRIYRQEMCVNPPSSTEQLAAVSQQVDGAGDVCLVWQCRHLRTADHPAIEYATERYGTILPIFIIDPAFYGEDGLACDARIRFMCESLADLADQYESLGGGLTMLHGDPVGLLKQLDRDVAHIVTTADPTGRYGLRRDNAVAEACEITFVDADGLRRDVADSRENWSDHVESYLTAPRHEIDTEETDIECVDTAIDPAWVEDYYDITPTKQISRRGGTTHGRQLLDEFIEDLSAYPGNISAPADARTGTSQLSPYLRFGCLSVRQVYQAVVDAPGNTRATKMFKSRLYWNRHYNQKLADWSGWMEQAVNPVLEGFHEDTYDPDRVEAWKTGTTGYPMVDASMRCLRQTGWLNFRMRAMCASFLCDLLQQPWKIGADFFYYHLLDADPAINYTQFQLQAGVDGTNMLRIYNPRKQVRDNDPDGEFITTWVPELEPLPASHLDQPEKTPLHVQAEVGVQIGETYPYPIVEYEAAREAIIEKVEAVREPATKALQHPEVNRRASLSRRGGTTQPTEGVAIGELSDTEAEQRGQSSLSDFT